MTASAGTASEAPRLEQGRVANARKRAPQIVERIDGGVGGDGNAKSVHEVLLGEPVLGDGERLRRRKDGNDARRGVERRCGHILELASHDIDTRGKSRDRIAVAIRADRCCRRDVEGRGLALVGIDVRLEAESRGSHGEHAAELAAAEDTDRAAGRQLAVRHYPRPPRRRTRFEPRARP